MPAPSRTNQLGAFVHAQPDVGSFRGLCPRTFSKPYVANARKIDSHCVPRLLFQKQRLSLPVHTGQRLGCLITTSDFDFIAWLSKAYYLLHDDAILSTREAGDWSLELFIHSPS